MAKIIDFDGELPKRIGDHLIYKLDDTFIIRKKSGFTSEALLNNEKYIKSRRTAAEFGKVSSVCKAIRLVLKEVLPKRNNLQVVNYFTKKMCEVIKYDIISEHGTRNLANALKNEEGKKILENYNFNPDCKLKLKYLIEENQIVVENKTIIYPEGITHIGYRVAVLQFDIENGTNKLVLGNWMLFDRTILKDTSIVYVPYVKLDNRFLFTLLEVQFYTNLKDDYQTSNELDKALLVVEVG